MSVLQKPTGKNFTVLMQSLVHVIQSVWSLCMSDADSCLWVNCCHQMRASVHAGARKSNCTSPRTSLAKNIRASVLRICSHNILTRKWLHVLTLCIVLLCRYHGSCVDALLCLSTGWQHRLVCILAAVYSKAGTV